MKKIILASASPRRRELLSQIGLKFKVYPASLIENKIIAQTPEKTVLKIALKKAKQVSELFLNEIVIGADTIVVYKNKILGKPENTQEAIEMLSLLSGNTHKVLTGIAIINKAKKIILNDFEKTYVSMRKINLKEIINYVRTGEPMDKAGAYAIQGEGQKFILNIDGSYSNVVGLPLEKLETMLRILDIKNSMS
ncbi:MAG: septum formation inhibitor Maf [Candidatus Firestonebacteria bacterium]|nr:septum formation inhibitor Maf [Candidatus Firestonebacteria bacterium]